LFKMSTRLWRTPSVRHYDGCIPVRVADVATQRRAASRLTRGAEQTINKVGERLRVAFLPWGVTNDYYAFTLWYWAAEFCARWRILPRVCGAVRI
jgi:hypothetical protein